MKVKQKLWIENVEQFQLSKLNKYINKFEKLKDDGYIAANIKFEDRIWRVKIIGVELNLNFLNNIELMNASKELKISQDFIDSSIKSFLLDYIENTSQGNIKIKLNYLKSLINRELIERYALSVNVYDFTFFCKFNDFIGGICSEYIESITEYAVERDYKNKKIPSFVSVFKFDDVIEEFYRRNKNNIKVLLKWYPIIVWWKLTSVIPLRPSELINMDRLCIDEINGEYFIIVKRSLGKISGFKLVNSSNENECYYNDKINIDEKMYKFLKKYIKDMENYGGKYLFSKELYMSYNLIQPNLNKNKFTVANLTYLLNRFYDDFIQHKKGYVICNRYEKPFETLEEKEIERLSLYDSRHIAIINAIFLGYDIQTVQRLARHKVVNTTYGYFRHEHEYAKSFALSFSKKMLHKNDLKKIPNIKRSHNHGRLLASVVLGIDDVISVNRKDFKSCGGYCEYNTNKDILFCMKYLPNHVLCPKFIPYDEDVQIGQAEKKLENCIKVLCDIVKDRETIANFDEKMSIQRDAMLNNTYELAHLLAKKEK
ncbi:MULTISPECIES: site-specific integrase [Clostridium]|uniref:Site-specific integrase n=2 Tax=Clostridium TaxID=1485 RepID=A0A3R5QXG3_9CLOT|nr:MULTISPECIES: site-specific integrase [Clostridium]EKQ57673.1 MAG: hypothetical protein A370_00661 [Clostridium sp. Maddingley MBC34-26]OOP74370.1 hypothetical protein CBEIBR21_07745 [Clostridium beijerinckii]QAA31749.1 site-specific integrase [Clostridium manihotivorum]